MFPLLSLPNLLDCLSFDKGLSYAKNLGQRKYSSGISLIYLLVNLSGYILLQAKFMPVYFAI